MGAPTAVDLFSGAGGMALGLLAAGFDIRLASDVWPAAQATYMANFDHPFLLADIRDLDAAEVIRLAGGVPDLVAGGPPCQGFSPAGKRDPGDTRSTLVGAYARLAADIGAPVVVFENVEGFLTMDGGRFVTDLLDPLVEAGYVIELAKLDVAGFGVPQHRKRIIGIACLGRCPVLPVAFTDAPGVGTVLGHGADPEDEWSQPAWPEGAVVQRIRMLCPGQTMADLPEELHHASYRAASKRRVSDGTDPKRRGGAPVRMRRLDPALPSPAITSDARLSLVHPWHDRFLTIREAALLQGFPADHQFVATAGQAAALVGNAIPPLFARHVAEAVLATLRSGAGPVRLHVGDPRRFSPSLRDSVNMVTNRYATRTRDDLQRVR